MECSNPTIEELVDGHLDAVYRFAFHLTGASADAEDLVQETFLVAQRKLHQLRQPESALAWLLQIARRLNLRRVKQPALTELVPLDELASPEQTSDVPDDVDPERVFDVVGRMPEQYREPLLLFYLHELRYREIAQIVDCPIGTVMSRLSRAKAYLRSRLLPAPVPDEG